MSADDWPELDLDEALRPVEFEWPDLNAEVAGNG